VAYETDWIKVGTAGKTIDGRQIEEQWLKDMARLYDPVGEYKAQVWAWDHGNKFTTYGHVTAVKAGKDEQGRLALFLRLKPTPELVQLNRAGQLQHSSMEIHTNYKDEGSAYLIGLLMTNNPASIGTQEVHLSALEHAERICRTVPEGFAADLNDPAEQMPKWFKPFAKFFSLESKESKKTEVDVPMTPEQFTKFEELQKQQLEAIQALSAQLTKPAETSKPDKTVSEPVAPVMVGLSAEQVSELISKKLEEFAAKPNGQATAVPVNTGSADPANPAEWQYDY
jgi:hypothetical protein